MPKKNRWYDHHPTVSMAISLYQNANRDQQIKTFNYVSNFLENYPHFSGKDLVLNKVCRIVDRREDLTGTPGKLVDILKQLPLDVMEVASLNVIHYIYYLEAEALMPTDTESALTG